MGSESIDPPRVSGALPSHYAPRTLTRLLSADAIDAIMQHAQTKNVAVLSTRKHIKYPAKLYDARIPHREAKVDSTVSHWIIMPTDPHAYAHRLYEQLHFADSLQCQEILIEQTPNTPEWSGILDRITKASCR